MKLRASIAAVLLLLTHCGVAAAQDLEKGEQLYQDYLCYSCHGYNGTSPLRPLANDLSAIMTNEALFLSFLRLRADFNPANASRAMPSYSETELSDEKARDIYAYIKTFKENPPEVADDPLMQEILDAAKEQEPTGK